MSLKSKIEAVIYASEEPVTLPQLVGLLGDEAAAELQALDALQTELPLGEETAGTVNGGETETQDNAVEVGAIGGSDNGDSLLATHMPEGPQVMPARGDNGAAEQAAVLQEAVTEIREVNGQVAEGAAAVPLSTATTVPESTTAHPEQAQDLRAMRERERQVREYLRRTIDALIREYAESDRGIEIREVAGGFRMGTKPEYHDAVRGFVKSLKPALKLTLQALETLAVVAYKQPVTAAEVSEIRGVDSAGVLGGLIGRKLIAAAGRKQVIGRPMLYKTTREFLVRFGLKDVLELPSMEEFERLAGELNEQEDLPMESTEAMIERANARGDRDHMREVTGDEEGAEDSTEAPAAEDAGYPGEPLPQIVAAGTDGAAADSSPFAESQPTETATEELSSQAPSE